MHSVCMASRTISLHEEAYQRLKAAKRSPHESFTQVVLRAVWPEQTLTGRQLLARLRSEGPLLSESVVEAIEDAKRRDKLPEDKWRRR
jgi:predicted CopG family antitoxin